MSLIRSLFVGPRADPGPVAVERSAYPVPYLGPIDGWSMTSAGEYVDAQTALRFAAVAACRRVIVASILAMPAHSYTVVSGQRGKLERDLFDAPIVASPSARTSKRSWISQAVNSLVLEGNVYGLVSSYDRDGYPASVEILPNGVVSWQPDADGVKWPTIKGKTHKLYPVGDLVHQCATPWQLAGSPVAQSPVELAKESIGTGQAAERFGAHFFRDGFHPTAIAYSDDPDMDPETAKAIKATMIRMTTGNREPGVFGSGVKVEQVPVTSGDSQFVDLMRYEAEQAARFFGVPPSMIYATVSGQAVTYQNVADSDLQFLKHSLRSWVDDLEEMWTSLRPPGKAVRLTPEGLVRMDPAGRHALYKTRLEAKSITVNEIRELEDEPPLVLLNSDGANVFDLPGIPDLSSERSLSPVEAIQKVYLGVGKIVTADEARQIVNDLTGTDLALGVDVGAPATPDPDTSPMGATP